MAYLSSYIEVVVTEVNEVPWNILKHVQAQIVMADAKAAGLLTANGVITGVALSNLEGIKDKLDGHYVGIAFAVLATVCLFISIIVALACFLPNYADKENKNHTSLIFFKHIARLSSADYQQRLRTIRDSADLAFEEIVQQISALSAVASEKFDDIRRSTTFAAIALGLGIIAVVVTL